MLGENLKALRTARGLSQEALAGRLNVVRQTVSKWEKNLSVPDADLLQRLAKELDVSVEVLLDGSAPPAAGTDAPLPSPAERRRRELRLVCIVFAVLAGFALAAYLLFSSLVFGDLLHLQQLTDGAGLPPYILRQYLVAGAFCALFVLAALAVLIAACVGIYRTRKRK